MASEILDFTDVKDRSQYQPRNVPEGDYTAKIVSVETTTSKSDNEKMWVFGIKLDDRPSGTYPYYCKLTVEQLWKVRNILVAAGISVPKRKMKVDPNKAVGKSIGVSMVDDEYEGRMKSVIDSIFPSDDATEMTADDSSDDEEDTDEDPPMPTARKKGKRKPEPEPEPEEEDDDEDEEEDEEEPEPTPPPKAKKGKRKPPPPPADEDDDLDVDDDDL